MLILVQAQHRPGSEEIREVPFALMKCQPALEGSSPQKWNGSAEEEPSLWGCTEEE